MEREPVLWIRPGFFADEAGEVEDGVDYWLRELVAVLGVDAFSLGEVHAHLERRNIDDLRTRAFEMHFHTGKRRIPECDVLEGGGVEVGVEFTIDVTQDVAIEFGGNA